MMCQKRQATKLLMRKKVNMTKLANSIVAVLLYDVQIVLVSFS